MPNFFKNRIIEYFTSFPSYTNLGGGTNIYNLGGNRGGSINTNQPLEAVNPNIVFYCELLNTIGRLSEYRSSDLSATVLSLYKDSVLSLIDFTLSELVVIDGDTEWTKKINKILKDINIADLISSSLEDFIYNGSISYALEKNKDKFTVKDFIYPYTTGYSQKDKKFVVQTDDGAKYINNTFSFRMFDLKLLIDDPTLEQLGKKRSGIDLSTDKKSKIFAKDKLLCSRPLFANVELKVKDYILKDLISSFLSLIALIEQDTFTIDAQRSTDMDSILKLCDRIKGLLVTKDDMNLLASAKLNKEALVRRLFDRVRVIPSIASSLNGMQEWSPTRLKEKLDSLLQQKDVVRDELLTTIGFPLDLYKGSTNRWEVERQNDRYNLKLIFFRDNLKRSLTALVIQILSMYNKICDEKAIKWQCFKLTSYELQSKLQEINNNREVLVAIQDLIRAASDLKDQSIIQDKNQIKNLVTTIFKNSGVNLDLNLELNSDTSM